MVRLTQQGASWAVDVPPMDVSRSRKMANSWGLCLRGLGEAFPFGRDDESRSDGEG
jgi:hypothetical protein